MRLLLILLLNFIPVISNKVTSENRIKENHPNVIVDIEQEFKKFSYHMEYKESSFVWDTINPNGYIGLYQFGSSALKMVGFGFVTPESFRDNPQIFNKKRQRTAFKRLVRINIKLLKPYIKEYKGKIVFNHKITKSGLIGAAHLAGYGNVIRFLKTGYDPCDCFGTHLTDYLDQFSNYHF
jgi:hypothetical protein